MKPKNKTLQHLAFIAFTGFSAPAVHAANDLWIGNTDANFATLSNWTGGVTPNGNTPQFGVAGTSGTTLNNDISSASYAGLTFNSGASAFTIGGNSFTLTGNITNSSSSLQIINTGMTIAAANRTLAGGAGGLTLGGTITQTQTATSAGLTITGTVNSAGTFTEDGGAANNAGYLSIGGNNTLNVTAGTFSVLGTSHATKSLSVVGQNAAGTSNLNVSGGNLVIGANVGFALANASTGTGVLTISSGTATINRGTTATTTNTTDTRMVMMGRDNTGSGIVNLNGGTLATDRQFVRDGSNGANSGTANFVFGGGTLKALGTQTDWLQSTTASSEGQNQGATGGTINTGALALSSVTTTAVSTIDANGFGVAINNDISGAGGFTISNTGGTGTGIVTFAGAKTYLGGTTVTAGTLDVTGTLADTGAVTVSGGTYKVSNDDTVAAVTLTSGTISNASGKVLTGSSYGMESGTVSGILGGSGTLTKSTSGTVTLSGANTYSGKTTVTGGSLALASTGSIASSSEIALNGGNFNVSAVTGFALGSSQSLTGSGGSVTGDITVTGTLAIGNSPGTMTFNNDLTIGSSAISNFEFADIAFGTGTYDLAQGGAGNQAVGFGGTLNLFFSGGTYANNSSVQIFDFETYSGGFTNVNFSGLGGGQSATFDASTGFVTVVPEPAAALLGGIGMLVLLRRRRKD